MGFGGSAHFVLQLLRYLSPDSPVSVFFTCPRGLNICAVIGRGLVRRCQGVCSLDIRGCHRYNFCLESGPGCSGKPPPRGKACCQYHPQRQQINILFPVWTIAVISGRKRQSRSWPMSADLMWSNFSQLRQDLLLNHRLNAILEKTQTRPCVI